MAFKASKVRKKGPREPIGRGTAIVPNAGVMAWYEGQMNLLVRAMLEDYKMKLGKTFEKPDVKEFYAADASAASAFKEVLNFLKSEWSDIFKGFAQKTSREFVEKTDEHATAATLHSLTVAGIDQPRAGYRASVSNTLEAAVDYNHTLIANLQEEVHEKIYSSVMLSLTSPDPEQQGVSGIQNALKEAGIHAKNRVKLIAVDQTSKLYSSLADERMAENGCEEFEWMHSSAGKTPRESHVEKDGKIFKLNDPRFWEGKKADQGPPGWAIRCRCRRVPIFRFNDDDE